MKYKNCDKRDWNTRCVRIFLYIKKDWCKIRSWPNVIAGMWGRGWEWGDGWLHWGPGSSCFGPARVAACLGAGCYPVSGPLCGALAASCKALCCCGGSGRGWPRSVLLSDATGWSANDCNYFGGWNILRCNGFWRELQMTASKFRRGSSFYYGICWFAEF